MNERPSTGEHPEQEPSDLRPGAILLCAAGVVLMVLLAALLAYLLTQKNSSAPGLPAASIYLSSDPVAEISRFERDKRSKLETYGWVDEQRFAHIPIEQAMQKLAAEKPTAGSSQ